MTRYLIPLLLLLLAATAHAQSSPPPTDISFENRCESQLPKTSVTLRSIVANYEVDQTVASKMLNLISVQAGPGDRMLGMTAIRSSIDFGYDGPSLLDTQSDRECIAPRIDVELRYVPLKVYVAREFNSSGCPYREVLDHELRHVRAYRKYMEEVSALVREALEKRFGDGSLMYCHAGRTYETLSREVNGHWVPFIRAELRKIDAFHKAIDTTEETFRMSAACGGEVAYLIGRY